MGLNSGVDDYMIKPFSLEELLLRVERLLTRVSWNDPSGSPRRMPGPVTGGPFGFGRNRVDLETGEAECAAGRMLLTEQELKLMRVFAENPGRPLSRRLLLEVGWGYSRFTSTRTVDNFIVRLRKYFEDNPKKPCHFKSIRSKGYVFDPDGDP